MTTAQFVEKLKGNDLKFFATVPCTITSDLHKTLSAQIDINLFTTYHEHNLPGLAAGHYLATGKPAVIHMQNSGFSNALDGLLTCIKLYKIPVLVLVTWRGDTPEDISEPHQLIGEITEDLTSTLNFPVFGNRDGSNFEDETKKALAIVTSGKATILRIASKVFERDQEDLEIKNKTSIQLSPRQFNYLNLSNRDEAIKQIAGSHESKNSVFIYSNGYTARAAFSTVDSSANFYNIGYMGGSLALGYSLAKANQNLDIVVIDGDQNAEMSCMKDHLFNQYPSNLYYYIIDNGSGASVGNTKSVPLAEYYSRIANIIKVPPDPEPLAYPRIKYAGGLPMLVKRLREHILNL